VGFHQDEVCDWVADLECGHGQHVRHHPPWSQRPWVTSAAGREQRIGTTLDCRLCDGGDHTGVDIWRDPVLVTWCGLLLDSFRHWTGRELISRAGSAQEQARTLFFAPLVVVSHGTESDPVLNYGNQAALELWEASWGEFIKTPSRVTAEPINRAERNRMLERTMARGFIDDYRGVRISLRGRRFLVENALVWNVIGPDRVRHGQAATFSRWHFL
jgi:hypothetical protein